ncbi:hypothetical protein CAEBREN_11411 [Caenorhabditis brenneri]|uniref:Carboxylic ester hydrolase n=1 Tax=Caenorhabditis brenneri TaxID=135651 RepID=G0MSA1_CAEBE|nr:hypothetical protein CAEBREN_11411 [Caenorhabditis brenneri]
MGGFLSHLKPENNKEVYHASCGPIRGNIYKHPNGLPVLIYIHGGGFKIGYSAYFNDYSLSGTIPLRDIVVVTVNYRLGPLGFLTTGDDLAKGNYGLWDQTLALKWVQEHIASFGGDPNNVTVSGESAGGISVDMLALSPHSNNSQSLVDWYQAQDVEVFKKTGEVERDFSRFIFFVPNFDGDFFPKPLEQLRKEAPKLDALITVAEYEGLAMMMDPLCISPDSLKNMKSVISDAFDPNVTNNCEEVQRKLLEAYTRNVNVDSQQDVAKKLVEFLGDYLFNSCALNTAKSCKNSGAQVYLASFDYFNAETDENPAFGIFPFKAATHGSDHAYVFGDAVVGVFKPNDEELKVMELMGSFVANFVKYGQVFVSYTFIDELCSRNPNGKNSDEKWKPYCLDQPDRYFKIDYPISEMRENFQNGRLEVFEEIKKYDIRYQNIVIGKSI